MEDNPVIEKVIPKEGPFIAWNTEKSERDYMGVPCIDYNFFMRYKNVKDIVEAIDNQFFNTPFGGGVEKEILLRQNLPGSVNEYLLIKYSSPRKPEKFSLRGLGMKVVKDENLRTGHRKHRTIKEYARTIIGINQ